MKVRGMRQLLPLSVSGDCETVHSFFPLSTMQPIQSLFDVLLHIIRTYNASMQLGAYCERI